MSGPRDRERARERREPGVASIVERAGVLAALELEVGHRLDGLVHGDFLGISSGPGSEPADARRYTPGDDARRIDWNLTARSSDIQTRTTEPDRELELWIVADRSASLDFGTAHCEERDLVLAAAAAFGLRTLGHGNRVGMVLAGGERLQTCPPRSDRAPLFSALVALHRSPRREQGPARGADLEGALAWLQQMARRRGVIVVVSDFLDATTWPSAIRRLAMRHDVIAVQVVDPRELELPSVGMLSLVDTESGEVMHVQTGSARLRERYRRAALTRHDGIRASLQRAGASHVVLSTDRDWVLDIAHFLSERRLTLSSRRRAAASELAAPRGPAPEAVR